MMARASERARVGQVTAYEPLLTNTGRQRPGQTHRRFSFFHAVGASGSEGTRLAGGGCLNDSQAALLTAVRNHFYTESTWKVFANSSTIIMNSDGACHGGQEVVVGWACRASDNFAVLLRSTVPV